MAGLTNNESIHSTLRLQAAHVIVNNLNTDQYVTLFGEAFEIARGYADPNDPDTNINVHNALLEKRKQVIDLEDSLLKINTNKDVMFTPLAFDPITLDLSKVPAVTYDDFTKAAAVMLGELADQKDQDGKVIVDNSVRRTLMGDVTTENIEDEVKKDFFKNLFKGDKMGEGSVNFLAIKMHLVIDDIIKASMDTEKDTLSPMSAKLLQLMVNVMTCPSGKEAGVELVYRSANRPTALVTPKELDIEELKKSFMERDDISLDGLEEMLKKPLNNFIVYRDDLASKEAHKAELETKIMLWTKDFRQGLISGDSPLMKELTGTKENEEIAEPSHQTKYVKSLIGDLVGLTFKDEAKIPFDVHGRVVNATLRGKTRQDVADAFFQYDTVDGEIAYLTDRLNEALEGESDQSKTGNRQTKHTIQMMSNFFDAPTREELNQGILPCLERMDCFALKNYTGPDYKFEATKKDEEDEDLYLQAFPVAIKEEGVKQLLLKMGRLKEVVLMDRMD